ncbi:hypothetical protein Ocin01_07496 [Orchesella cincta]|uniref:Uncharacterized protein n=1 Tax=Orchesella cincta TaxID=48709 RepID=A0A1D2N2C6_ORCCI|nr:hypothetical protein Ocin01_07496 [Orchesella cincta]
MADTKNCSCAGNCKCCDCKTGNSACTCGDNCKCCDCKAPTKKAGACCCGDSCKCCDCKSGNACTCGDNCKCCDCKVASSSGAGASKGCSCGDSCKSQLVDPAAHVDLIANVHLLARVADAMYKQDANEYIENQMNHKTQDGFEFD